MFLRLESYDNGIFVLHLARRLTAFSLFLPIVSRRAKEVALALLSLRSLLCKSSQHA